VAVSFAAMVQAGRVGFGAGEVGELRWVRCRPYSG